MANSCNTPFAAAAVDLGQDKIREVAERFGFNQDFEVPLDVAASRFPQDLDDAALAQSAIGQRDVQATALQMNMVASGIANGGMLMEPQLVESIRRSDLSVVCLLYTSDAADDTPCVDLGGRLADAEPCLLYTSPSPRD